MGMRSGERKFWARGVVTAAAVTVLAMICATAAHSASDQGAVSAAAGENHVKICHAIGNGGYVVIEPSAAGVFEGHLASAHGGHGADSDDIIPPFEHGGHVYSQNWPDGRATFDNGCKRPADPPVTDGGGGAHVTICHALGNGGYVKIAPSASGVVAGHLGGHGGHGEEADIVPPFEYEGHTYSQNWPDGKSTFEHDCRADTQLPPPGGGSSSTGSGVTTTSGGSPTATPVTTAGAVEGVDLSITKRSTKRVVRVGRRVTFVVVVRNLGSRTATGVVMDDLLPRGMGFVSAGRAGGPCRGRGRMVRCTLGTLRPGAARTLRIVVRPLRVGSLTNVATVVASERDSEPANNIARANVRVRRGADGAYTPRRRRGVRPATVSFTG